MRLPARASVRFVGDLHLGDGGSNDTFGAHDRLLVAFLRECESTCDAVVFMGDTFDVPQAWSVARVARAHPEVVRAIEALCTRTRVVFIRGNHDWGVPYSRIFAGAETCTELTIGSALVCHGHRFDRYCNPDRRLHRHKIALHNLAERVFGFEFRVPLADHDTRRNRIAHWLGHKYACYLQYTAALYNLLGKTDRAAGCEEFIGYWSRAVWGDPHALFQPATDFARRGPYQALICGHTHLPGVVDLGGGCYVNAGSWAFGAAQAATWGDGNPSVRDYERGTQIHDEHYRWMLCAQDPGDFFVWWKRHYKGLLRFRDSLPPGRAGSDRARGRKDDAPEADHGRV